MRNGEFSAIDLEHRVDGKRDMGCDIDGEVM